MKDMILNDKAAVIISLVQLELELVPVYVAGTVLNLERN